MTLTIQIVVDPATLQALQTIIETATGASNVMARLNSLYDQLKASDKNLSDTIAK